MPLYEYYCPCCKKQFEILQKITEANLKQCPDCQAEGIEKLISPSNFHLKGQGWYKTDYAPQKDKAVSSSDSTPIPSQQAKTPAVNSTTTQTTPTATTADGKQ